MEEGFSGHLADQIIVFYKLGLPYLYRSFQPLSAHSWLPFIQATLYHKHLAGYVKNLVFSTESHYDFNHEWCEFRKNTAMYTPATNKFIDSNRQAMEICMDSRTIGYQIPTSDHENNVLQNMHAQTSADSIPSSQGKRRAWRLLRSLPWMKQKIPPKSSTPESSTPTVRFFHNVES